MVEIITRKIRRESVNYQLGREKANPISETTRTCDFALREEVWSGFSACALNSDS